ncbi:MAG: restriction endonuclease, partial [Anaerolineales bacterium]
LFWLGHDPRRMSTSEIGSHLRHQREDTDIETYRAEMALCLKRIARGLAPGRFAAIVIGDGVYKGKVYDTARILAREAKKLDLQFIGEVDRAVHPTKRSFISPARRIRSEKILILKKPCSITVYELSPPSYKAWPYEHELRRLEAASVFKSDCQSDSQDGLRTTSNTSTWRRMGRLAFTHGASAGNVNSMITWQGVLENGDPEHGTKSTKNSKYLTHGIHDYKGKFYPQLAKSLLTISDLPPSSKVLDPFCGSGTLILEAYLATDINPLAIRISKAKLEILELDPAMVDDVIREFIDTLHNLDDNMDNWEEFPSSSRPELESWFPSSVLSKLGILLRRIRKIPNPAMQNFMLVCLSSIIREVSQQNPNDLRIRRRKNELRDAPVEELLKSKLDNALLNLRRFWEVSNWSPDILGKARLELADCRQNETFATIGLHQGEIDAIITSPPYATALPYIDTDRLSLLTIDGFGSSDRKALESSLIGSREITKRERRRLEKLIESNDFGTLSSASAIEVIKKLHSLNSGGQVGFRRQNKAALLYRYYSGMCAALDNFNTLVKSSGSLIFVVGDNWTKAGGRRVTIPTTKFLVEEANTRGWKLKNSISITVTRENRVHRRNSITDNQILHFLK